MQLIPSLLLCAMSGQPLMMVRQGIDELSVRVLGQQRQIDNKEITRGADYFARTSHKYTVADGIARIELHGVMVSEPDWILDAFGVTYTVTPHFAAAIRDAAARSDVHAIHVDANTPGGSVVGLQSCYETVRDAAKPVICSVSGMLASAGVYVMAAADQIIAEPAAIIGSIGTVMRLADSAKMYENFGITMHMIASGPDKGVGSAGVPIAPEQLQPFQALVDQLAGQFVDVVAEGRGMPREQVVALATGAAWVAAEAHAKGLIDSIHSQPQAFAGGIAREHTMLTKEQLKALQAKHPAHAALINAMDDQGKDAQAIEAAVADANFKALNEQVTAANTAKATAEAALVAEQTAHAATKQALTAANAKYDALAKLGGGAPQDPGADAAAATDATSKLDDASLKAEWQAMPKAKRAGFLNDYDTFAIWKREQAPATA